MQRVAKAGLGLLAVHFSHCNCGKPAPLSQSHGGVSGEAEASLNQQQGPYGGKRYKKKVKLGRLHLPKAASEPLQVNMSAGGAITLYSQN